MWGYGSKSLWATCVFMYSMVVSSSLKSDTCQLTLWHPTKLPWACLSHLLLIAPPTTAPLSTPNGLC